MKALWIRVDAHAIDSIEVARFAEELGVDVVTAFGHYCALGGAIAEQAPDGQIAGVPALALERWGRWGGKRGKLADAVRSVLQTEDGTFGDWLDSMGKLIERREKERARKSGSNGAETPPTSRGNSAEPPQPLRGISGATERNGTERNGTEISATEQNSKMRSGELHRDALRARDVPAPAPRAAPPADAAVDAADLPREALDFLETFHGSDSPKRRADILGQLAETLGDGAKLDKRTRIRAGSRARLARKCREVIDEGVRNRDRAIVVLLKKLGDTSDGSAPGVTLAAANDVEQRRDEHETSEELERASAWLAEHPEIDASIDEQLERDGFLATLEAGDVRHLTRIIARNALLLTAWRHAGSPEVVHA